MLRGLHLLFVAFWATLVARLSGRPRHPSWPFKFEWIVRYMRLDWDDTAAWDLVQLREDMARRPFPKDYARKVPRADINLASVPGSRFSPPRLAEKDGLILFLHGGSYLFGSSTTTHREMMARLAFETGLPVVAPDFRLAPEHPYPAQLHDALAVYSALLQDGASPDRLVIVGDSSGGNLAISLALALRDQGVPLPRALGLLSPWVDLDMPGQSFSEYDRYDFGTREVLLKHALAFAGQHVLSDPRISPTHADLSGLCPCLVIVGELELPKDDILSFHTKLKEAGVATQLHIAPQMTHNPPALAGLHPEADIAIRKLASFVLSQL